MEWSFRDKIKLLLGTLAITAGVFFIFKYLFWLIWPFALGLLMAYLIEKPVCKLASLKLFKGKKMVAASILMTIIFAVLLFLIGGIFYVIGREIQGFLQNLDYNIVMGRQMVAKICCNFDDWFGMSEGCSYRALCGCVDRIMIVVTNSDGTFIKNVVSKVVTLSFPVIKSIVVIVSEVVILFLSAIYLVSALPDIRRCIKSGIFSEELKAVKDEVSRLIKVYFKIELIIMIINGALCVVVLMLLKNPYALIIGISIGVIDALPIFGTGTILIPWVIVMVLMKNIGKAAVLFVLYLATYFVREIMESKCLGDKMGIAPFTMLAVIFIGILVFGIMGFILGPLSYCIIKALVIYLKTVIESDKLNST